MAIPRVKVVNPTESCIGTACYIDGKQIRGVRSVDFRAAVDEVPQFTFETLGLGESDVDEDTEKSQEIVVLDNTPGQREIAKDLGNGQIEVSIE